MSFLTGRVSCLRFRVSGTVSPLFDDEHLDRLRDHQAGHQRIASADGVEVGWAAGDSILDTDFGLEKNIVNDALCFDFRVDTDKPPADLLKAYYQAELNALKANNPSGLASARQKREAKEIARDRIEGEAKDGRFKKRKCIPVLWDRTTNTVLFGATSLTHLDRFTTLFEQTFGFKLECQTSGMIAGSPLSSHALSFPLGTVAAQLSPFIPNVTPEEASWIANEKSLDFLGNEFLLWLWYTGDIVTDTVTCPDGSECTFMLTRTLALDCPRGQGGTDGFRHEGPGRLPEARRAAQSGKLPRQAGLTLVRHNSQYEFTLHAETLAIAGGKLPASEDAETARAVREHRVEATRDLLAAMDNLYASFLALRLSAQWPGIVAGMQKWLSRKERADDAPPSVKLHTTGAPPQDAFTAQVGEFLKENGATVEVRRGGAA